MSEPSVDESSGSTREVAANRRRNRHNVASAAEMMRNHRENPAAVWYKDGVNENDHGGACRKLMFPG